MKHSVFFALLVLNALSGCGGKVDSLVPAQPVDPGPDPGRTDPGPPPGSVAPPPPPAATQGATVIMGDARGIAIDGTSIYVIDVMGAVSRIPRAGGVSPSLIAPASAAYVYPGGLAVDDTYLYWTKLGFDDASGQVVRMPKAGGPVEVLADARRRPQQLAIDDAQIYWAEQGSSVTPDGDGAVAKISKTGGAVTELASKQAGPSALVLHGDDVYWANGPSGSLNGTVQRVSKTGGPPTMIVGARDTIGALAVAGDRIYWTESPGWNDGRVFSVPLSGGAAAESPGCEGSGPTLNLVGDKLLFAARRDPNVALLQLAPGAASATVVSTTSYPNAITYFPGQVGVSDAIAGYAVDVWFDPATGPRSVIHTAKR